MAKGKKSVKRSATLGNRNQGVSIEHQETFDDNLLPDAKELNLLQKIDPNIMEWIKNSATKEQNARHDFNDRRMKIIEKGQKKSFSIDVMTIFSALIVILSGMLFSYYLISQDMKTVGTLFGGATVIIAASSFLNFRKKNKK